MNPRVTVVIDAIPERAEFEQGQLQDFIESKMDALGRQTLPLDQMQIAAVVDSEVAEEEREQVSHHFPELEVIECSSSNYFAAKNRGVEAAEGEFVAFLDGDCTPEPEWLERLVARFESDVVAVAGWSRFPGKSLYARTLSVLGFANVLAERDGEATGFNLSCVAFRREALVETPLDPRIRRHGGCYFLFHQIRRRGGRVLYEPAARIEHDFDFKGLGILRKHYDKGYDAVQVHRLDDKEALRGTRLFRRFGPLALIAFTGRRILIDWIRLARHHRQMGVPALALPYFAAVGAGFRLVELTGSVIASLNHPDQAQSRT